MTRNSETCAECHGFLDRVDDLEQQIEEIRGGYASLIEEWMAAYAQDIFTPLTVEEMRAMDAVIPNGTARVFAGAMRHWAGVLNERAAATMPVGPDAHEPTEEATE